MIKVETLRRHRTARDAACPPAKAEASFRESAQKGSNPRRPFSPHLSRHQNKGGTAYAAENSNLAATPAIRLLSGLLTKTKLEKMMKTAQSSAQASWRHAVEAWLSDQALIEVHTKLASTTPLSPPFSLINRQLEQSGRKD
jgi:hypothetical protein